MTVRPKAGVATYPSRVSRLRPHAPPTLSPQSPVLSPKQSALSTLPATASAKAGPRSALVVLLLAVLCLAWAVAVPAAELSIPQDVTVIDRPNDAGGALTATWAPADFDGPDVRYEIFLEEVPDPEAGDRTSKPSVLLVTEFPSNTHYVQDVKSPWWSRIAPLGYHRYDITRGNDVTLKDGSSYTITVAAVQGFERAEVRLPPVVPSPNWINWNQLNNFLLLMLFGSALFVSIRSARRAQSENREIFLRRIPGLDAVDEAIGRATELGKPILFLTGAGDMGEPSTIAAAVILGRVSKRVAAYETELLVPHRDPIVMAVCQEITKQSYLEAGKPEAFKEDSNFFITPDQFSYTAAVDGIMLRKKPAANFFMGSYFAESLLLTETGASTGAIQIAGTDSDHQMPFFVTTCDYTLIGEELYAASAYLSREPVQVGTLRGQDLGKAVILGALVLGTVLATVGLLFDAQWPALLIDLVRDLK